MTGMKEGAGEDPFATDDEASADAGQSTTSGEDASTTETTETDERSGDDRSVTERETTGTTSGQSDVQIPYKFRRDGVQDGRRRVPLFLHEDTKSDEHDALRTLEAQFDDDVSLTDLREALLKVGLDHLDEVEHQMEAWGYGMSFE